MKFKSNINIGNKDYLINFKHTNFFSIYKLKEIFYIIKNFFIKYKIN